MSNRKWNRLPPFSYTPSPHRHWRHPEHPPDEPDGDTDWADDDSQAANSTTSRTPSTGPPRKKRKTRKHFFTRPKSSASTREPTWEPEEEDPDMLDSITVAGGFLIVGQGAIDPLSSSPPPPPPSKKRGPGRPPVTPKTPKTPGSIAKTTKGKAKAAKKPTPSTSARKGRSATNAAKQVSPELGHPEQPHLPTKPPTTKRPGSSSANRGRRESPAPPRTATPPPLVQDNPMPKLRNEIPSSVIDSNSDTQIPSNLSTPTSTEPAPPEPPPAPAPAAVTWPTALTPPPPNPHVNELATRLTFNIYAFPPLNDACYVLGRDLLPPRDGRLSPLADIFPDAESPPRQEIKPCYERLRYVVGKEMGLLLPEAGADQEWGIFVNYHFPVQDQEQLDVCMAHLVHHGRPVHDIVLSKRGNPELYQDALENVRREDRDFWKGRRDQMPGVKTGVILLQRGVGMTKAKTNPRNKVKRKGKEKGRKQPAGKKRTAEEYTEIDPEIRDSMEPSPEPTSAPSVVMSSLMPEPGTTLLRISPVPNASQESRLVEEDKFTTSAPPQMSTAKVQRVVAPPPPASKDSEEKNESLQTLEETTDSAWTGKRKMGGYSSAASNRLGNNRNERSSAPEAETSSPRQKGKGKDVEISDPRESPPVAGPERKRRKIRIESSPSTLFPEAPAAPGKPEELEEPEAPTAADTREEPDISTAIDLAEAPEAAAQTHAPEDPEVPAQNAPTEEMESSKPNEPPKEIEPPQEIQQPTDIEPQTVPEISQASEIADSTASTETSETPETQKPTAATDATATDLPQEPLLATESSQTVVETIAPKIPVTLMERQEPTPNGIETPQEVAEEPPKALEEAAEEQPKILDEVKVLEPEAGENRVTTTNEHISQDIVDAVRVRARAQKLVTNEEVKEFYNLNDNRLIESEAEQKEAKAKEKEVDEDAKHADEGNLKAKVVNNNEEFTPEGAAGNEAVIEELRNDRKEESSPKELENDADIVLTKEPEVVRAAQGSTYEEPEEAPGEGVRQSTPRPEKQVDATALNAVATAGHIEGASKDEVLPPPAEVEEPQVSKSTSFALVVNTPSVIVAEGIEDPPGNVHDDSGHASAETDPPARASTPPLPPPPPLETVHTPIDTSSPDPNNNIDVITANNDGGESSVQPTMLPEQDLSAANTISEQDPTVPMDIDDESRPPVNDEQASKGKSKETFEAPAVPNEDQDPTVPERATNDAEAEGSSPAQTYSQSVVDIQHGARLLLWAAEVPTEELTADTPAPETSSPLPLALPVPTASTHPVSTPPASATPASAPAVQISEEPQVSQQLDKVHGTVAITPTPSVKRRSRAKNPASKDTAKPAKETAKPKAPKAKPTGQRASSRRSLIVSLKFRKPENAQDEGTPPSRAEESHPDGGAVAASTTRTPPPATPCNNWPPTAIGFTPVNVPSTPSPIRIPPSTPAPLPRPQPYRRPEPITTAPRPIAAKQGGVSPNPRSTPSAELLAAARKQTGQTKNAKSKVAGSRVGSATSAPDYPNAPIPPPIAFPGPSQQSLSRLGTNARRSQPLEGTASPNRQPPVQQQQQQPQFGVVAAAAPPVDEPIRQAAAVATTASPSQHVVPRPACEKPAAKESIDIARNVSPTLVMAIDKSKEMQVHPVPEEPPTAARPSHPVQAVPVQSSQAAPEALILPPTPAVQAPLAPLPSSGRRLGSSKLREVQSNNDKGLSNNTPVVTNPLPAARIDPQAPPAAREQTPAATTTASTPTNTSPETAGKAMASTMSPRHSIDTTTTRQSTPLSLSLPPARSTLTPEYIDSKKIQPLVPRENFLYWEPSIGKVGGADIKQPIGTLLGKAHPASVSPIHASASGLVQGFPTSMSSSGRPLFHPSPPPLRPLSPIWVSPSPSTQSSPQAQPPVQPKPQSRIQQPQVQSQVPPRPQSSPQVQPTVQPSPQPQVQQPQVQSQVSPQPQSNPQVQPRPQPQIQQPQVQSQVSPQPEPQVQLQTQVQTPPQPPPQPPVQTQPDVPPAPPPQLGPPALGPITTKEMIFNISHYEGNDQTFTLPGRDFLSPEGFNWNIFLGVLTKIMSFKEVSEVLVVNLHHLVDDGLSLDKGIPFYRKVNEVLIVKADPLGRPPTELWERMKSERKKLRERFME